MSHKLKVETRPVIVEGKETKRKIRTLIDRFRGRRIVVAEGPAKEMTPRVIREKSEEYRQRLVDEYLRTHPNDELFRRKHGIKS